jgi:hypothetical protein
MFHHARRRPTAVMRPGSRCAIVTLAVAALAAPARAEAPLPSPADAAAARARLEIPETLDPANLRLVTTAEDRAAAPAAFVHPAGGGAPAVAFLVRATEPGGDESYCVAAISVLTADGYEPRYQWLLGEHPLSVEAHDVDGDGAEDVLFVAGSGMHYTCLDLVSPRQDGLEVLFTNGTACHRVEIDLPRPGGALIVLGREDWDRPDFSWADSGEGSLKEAWRWQGDGFAHDPQLSTTAPVGEREALLRSVAAMARHYETIAAASAPPAGAEPEPGAGLTPVQRLALHLWIAGKHAYRLLEAGELPGR